MQRLEEAAVATVVEAEVVALISAILTIEGMTTNEIIVFMSNVAMSHDMSSVAAMAMTNVAIHVAMEEAMVVVLKVGNNMMVQDLFVRYVAKKGTLR
jgi:hypothetical protein